MTKIRSADAAGNLLFHFPKKLTNIGRVPKVHGKAARVGPREDEVVKIQAPDG
jgi:hypothetical protein